MKLNNDLDLKQLAQNAGLNPYQAEQFAKGLEGKHSNTMELARQPYTQLQAEFEKALTQIMLANPELTFPDEEDKLRPPFLYRTPKLATPIHNPAHPRADIIQSMIDSPTPLATFTCNFEELKDIKNMEHFKEPNTQKRLLNILSNNDRTIDPFTSNTKGNPTNHTFMATRFFKGLSPIQFEASQMPNLTNEKPGRLVFGEEALAAYERGLIQHHINRIQGRTSDFIKNAILE